MAEGKLRHLFDEYLGKAEVAIYSILAAMLSVTAFAALRPRESCCGMASVTGQLPLRPYGC
jgi:hypothetical protein